MNIRYAELRRILKDAEIIDIAGEVSIQTPEWETLYDLLIEVVEDKE